MSGNVLWMLIVRVFCIVFFFIVFFMFVCGSGYIVVIFFDVGCKVFFGFGVYFVSKFFVEVIFQFFCFEMVGIGLRVMVIQFGNMEMELLGMFMDKEVIKKFGELMGVKVLDLEDVVGVIVFVVCQLEYVVVNEVLIELRDEFI